MPDQIQAVQLSFIWVETIFNVLKEPPAAEAPLAFLGRDYLYVPKFEEILAAQKKGSKAPDLEVPWPKPSGQRFWQYYLELGAGKKLNEVRGAHAWRSLVPFRRKVPVEVKMPEGLPRPLLCEAFYYPFGLAFVVTARCESQLAVNAAVELAFKIRKTEKLETRWDQGAAELLSLDMLAGQALPNLRTAAFEPGAVAEAGSATPFTICTFIKAEGVDPNLPTPANGEIHRALEAMTGWRNTWLYDELPDLAQAGLKIEGATPSHVLYANKRGRAVWFPAYFSRARHTLSCYHRNLVFASLQTESLSGLVVETAKLLANGKAFLSNAHRTCAQLAAGILGRLYGGDGSIYRSQSCQVQIEQNNLVEAVNAVRDFFRMPKLSHP